MTTMKAIRVHEPGGPEALRYEEVPCPEPREGEVLVRVHAAGLNPPDLYARAGMPNIPAEKRPPIPLPFIPGTDLSGVVEALGPGVTEFKEGDSGFGLLRFPSAVGAGRTYAEYATAPVGDLAPKPARIDHVHAAAVPMSALTAFQYLFTHIGLTDGASVLVNGAACGVGHFLVQLARLKNARVTAVASGRHESFLRELGAERFIDYSATRVEDAIPDKVDLVIDTVGGPHGYRLLEVLRRGGIISPVFFGEYHDDRAAELGIMHRGGQVRSSGKDLAELGRLIDAGALRVGIDEVFPLRDAPGAHRRAEAGHVQGKIVLIVIDD